MHPESETNNNNHLVTVVIVNFNVGLYLVECVRTALPQANEVLVIDNASTDGSVALCEQHFRDEPKLKIIRNPSNRGFAVACNIGAMRAKNDNLFFLNPDCTLEGVAINELLQVLDSADDVGMVGGLLINEDGSEQGGGRRAVPTPWRSFVRAFGLNKFSKRWPKLFFDFHLHKQPLPALPIEVEAISGACMLVKRAAVEDVGLWDEGYFLHCEDLDWCMRFRQKEWKIMFVPSARVTHALGVSSHARPLFVSWHKHKGMIRFYRKFFRHQYPGILMGIVMLGVWLRFGLVASMQTAKRASKFWRD
jgi:GT2 family glycosyltransferase